MSKTSKLTATWLVAFFTMLAWISGGGATPPGTPLTVELALSRTPALNESATVTVTVESAEPAPGTLVELVLPDGVVAATRRWTLNLAPNRPVTLTSSVSFRRTGNIAVSARAFKRWSAEEAWSDMESIPLTVATATSRMSRRGWAVGALQPATQTRPGNAAIVSRGSMPFAFPRSANRAAAAELPSVRASLTPAGFAPAPRRRGTSTVTGTWLYQDRSGVSRAADQQLIEIRKADGSQPSPAVYCFTDTSGAFSCPYAHPGTNVVVWLRTWTNLNPPGGGSANRLGVFSGIEVTGGCGSDSIDCSYPIATGVISCADGATCSAGTWTVTSGVGEPWVGAQWMVQDLIQSWKKLGFDTKHGGSVTSGPARITYPVPSGHGTHAHVPPADGWISIEPPQQTAASVVTHEYGHGVQANLWSGFSPNWPPFDCPNPHFINAVGGPGCALYEGWGNFWMWYSTGSPLFVFAGGGSTNLETRDNGTFQTGDQVEGNVAAVFGDLFDASDDGPATGAADRTSDGIQHVWHTMSSQSDFNFSEWWSAYSASHSACPALEIVNFASINYSSGSCPYYSLAVSASPSGGGSASGGGAFINGRQVTVTATPGTGYTFVNWTDGGFQVSTSSSYTFNLTSNRTLVANFAPINYTISLSVSPSGAGTVSGGGSHPYGSSRTVSASAWAGYNFVNWTENGTQVSTQASYTFTVTGNRTLVANFAPINYTISLSASPPAGGSVSGGGSHPYGSSRTVTATANSGYEFVNWTESGSQVSTSTSYTFTINGGRTLVANFRQVHTISVSAFPSGGGTVTGGGAFASGSSRTVSATANSGYQFVNWTESGSQVSTSTSYTFTLTGNRSLVANFQQVFTVGLSASPSQGGTVSGGGAYAIGSQATISATPNAGYAFINWTENGIQFTPQQSFMISVTANRTFVANFQPTYSVNVSASPANGGTVGGGGTFASGSSRIVTATANAGYSFVRWTENGSQVSTSPSYSFTLTGNRTLVAQFRLRTYSITLRASPSAGGTVTGGGTYNHGSQRKVTATPRTGYGFLNWTQAGNVVSRLRSYLFTLTANRTLVANFTSLREFGANEETASSQRYAEVATLSGGGFVAVWQSLEQDGQSYGVYGQRFTATGARAGGEFRVNVTTAGAQVEPAVAALDGGGFVVVWASGAPYNVIGRRFDATGAPAGGEFRANSFVAGHQQSPTVAGLPGGGFVALWTSGAQDGSGLGVFGQRYAATGQKAGSEFRVNTRSAQDQKAPSVAGLTNGSFVAVWESANQDGSSTGIYAQRYSQAGVRTGAEFRVNTTTAGAQFEPSVAALPGGAFVAGWASGAQANVMAKRFSSAGAAQGGEVRVNTYLPGIQKSPAVARMGDDGYVFVWSSENQDGSSYGVFGQRFLPNGVRDGTEFRVNATTLRSQTVQGRSVAGFDVGGFVAVWTSLTQDGSQDGIFGRRFAP